MLFCAIWEQPRDNVRNFNEKKRTWNESVKPATLNVVNEYSLQGPKSRGVIVFDTDRSEDVNLFRNYFALTGLSMDIRVAIDLSSSIQVVERLQARW